MKAAQHSLLAALSVVATLSGSRVARAQTATVDLSAQKQYIRGFGGMNHPVWAGDLTAAQRTTAFGNDAGQLGFTALRMWVSDNKNDWTKEVATAKRAAELGAIVFATPWNPPSSMKSGGSINPSKFADYAAHLNSFVSYMKGQGVDLYAISVQNEPDYANDWTKWTQDQVYQFVLDYGSQITTKLITAESFSYNKTFYDPILKDANALKNVAILGTHLYGTAVSAYPYALFDQKGAGKERWMTEHYTDSNTDADSWPNALNVATELHNAMVEAQFNLYTWWYIRRSYGPIKENGSVSKRGWCMAQFSKFIRPGYHRVDATKSPTSGVYVSAYTGSSDVVLVIVNTNNSTKPLSLVVNGSNVTSYDRFTTSSSKNLASDGKITATSGAFSLTLDASSVTTLHGTGSVTAAGGSGGAGGASSTGGVKETGGATGTSTASGIGGARTSSSTTRSAGGSPNTLDSRAAGGATSASVSGTQQTLGGAPTSEGGTASGADDRTGTGGRGQTTASPLGTGGCASVGSARCSGSGVGVTETTRSNEQGTATDGVSSSDEGGCGCRLAPANSTRQWLSIPLIGLALGLLSRRRTDSPRRRPDSRKAVEFHQNGNR